MSRERQPRRIVLNRAKIGYDRPGDAPGESMEATTDPTSEGEGE